jgi:hypothetical protein
MGAWIHRLELAGGVDAGIQENQINGPSASGQVGQASSSSAIGRSQDNRSE